MRSRRWVAALVVLGFAVPVSGCGQPEAKPASTLTEAERDTVIARSDLPGAAVVQRALDVNGVAADRAAGADSVTR